LAVGIFLFHWVSLANGEKLADRGLLEPWVGMWLADIVTGLIALWLTFVVWRDLRSIPLPSLPSWLKPGRREDPSSSSDSPEAWPADA
jgi:lipopolysaccharide export system permease protein